MFKYLLNIFNQKMDCPVKIGSCLLLYTHHDTHRAKTCWTALCANKHNYINMTWQTTRGKDEPNLLLLSEAKFSIMMTLVPW